MAESLNSGSQSEFFHGVEATPDWRVARDVARQLHYDVPYARTLRLQVINSGVQVIRETEAEIKQQAATLGIFYETSEGEA